MRALLFSLLAYAAVMRGAVHFSRIGSLILDAKVYCGAGPGREVFILEDLKDANIVQFLGACFEEGSTMLVVT